MGAINNFSFTYPPFSLLTQKGQIREDMFCDEENVPEKCLNRVTAPCPCIHRIKVNLNSTVELTIVDESKGN